ncbi:hypothetical protein SAMN04490247_1433 [Salimicrobium halophilum]|uniref:Uncharacterized protein n=1 Tax=Salimicrobium halophilum TaxID=86666 RepID=A0A1G8SFN7_9BACI|nr:hypothetical protein SAMN04490247_1433 [Salimicrobium halophilum]
MLFECPANTFAAHSHPGATGERRGTEEAGHSRQKLKRECPAKAIATHSRQKIERERPETPANPTNTTNKKVIETSEPGHTVTRERRSNK